MDMTKILTILIAALIIGIILFIVALILIGRRTALRNLHPEKRYYLLLIFGIITVIPGVALPIVSGTTLVIVGSASKFLNAFSDYKDKKDTIFDMDEDMTDPQVKIVDKNGNERIYIIKYDADGNPHFIDKPDLPSDSPFGSGSEVPLQSVYGNK